MGLDAIMTAVAMAAAAVIVRAWTLILGAICLTSA
jgi:hypothetical protein